jgi:DNA-binding NarL/FixJ family response regulator
VVGDTLEHLVGLAAEAFAPRAAGLNRVALLGLHEAANGWSLTLARTPRQPATVVVIHRRPDSADAADPFAALSPREREVAALVGDGLTNRDIAARLYISIATVKDHVHHILTKSGLPNRAAVAGRWRAS